ncbi:cell division protein SepF [Micrococcales bacterium 31B]|nr:cell division protein SepF [Micrococcales bacterium 31B]
MKALRSLIHFVGLTEDEENHTGRLVVQERPTPLAAEPLPTPGVPMSVAPAVATPDAMTPESARRPVVSPAPVTEHAPIRPARPVAALPVPVAPSVGEEVNRIETVHPSTFNDVRRIGEVFREGVPVIMNLTGVEHADAVRMVDFATGLIFGTHGNITRVTERVFLLTPQTVAATEDEPKVVERDFAMLNG